MLSAALTCMTRVACRDGEHVVEAAPTGVPGLVALPYAGPVFGADALNLPGLRWRLTHAGTGLAIGMPCRCFAGCVAVAARIARFVRWDGDLADQMDHLVWHQPARLLRMQHCVSRAPKRSRARRHWAARLVSGRERADGTLYGRAAA